MRRVLALALLAIGCGDAVKGSGTLITEKRTVGAFTGVLFEDGISGEVKVGTASVSVTIDDNLTALIATTVENGVLVTGLAYPVVPRGDEEIRAQINADHTEGDIDHVLGLLEAYVGGET